MYRCKECQTEYLEKPDYCDCGNNTFDYIEEKKVEKQLNKKTLSIEEKSEIISRIFFAICLICSIAIMCIPIEIPNHKSTTSIPKKQNVKTLIPNIDKIWDDTPTYNTQNNSEQQPATVSTNSKPITLTTMPVDYARRIKKDTNTKIVTKKPQKKTSSNKPKSNSQPKQVRQEYKPLQKVEQPKIVNKNVQKPTKIVQPQKPVYNPNSPEMLKYKGDLRSVLFSKLAVGSISGNGECSIQFSIDLTGKLINRKFIKESNNKSLNDAVYYMLMRTPKFSAPPKDYNQEPIRMNFKFNNGNYEISIH